MDAFGAVLLLGGHFNFDGSRFKLLMITDVTKYHRLGTVN